MDKARLRRIEALAQPQDAHGFAVAVAQVGTVSSNGWEGAGMVVDRREGEDDTDLRRRVASGLREPAPVLMAKLADMLPN